MRKEISRRSKRRCSAESSNTKLCRVHAAPSCCLLMSEDITFNLARTKKPSSMAARLSEPNSRRAPLTLK